MSGERLVVGLLQSYLIGALRANALLLKAQAEGRPITREEFDGLRTDDNTARKELDEEIARQEAGG